MHRCWVLLALALAACGDGRASRGDCARAMAHVITLEDLEHATGDLELTREVGKDYVANQSTEEESWKQLKLRDELGGTPGESLRRVEECQAKQTSSEVECMLRSTTPTAAHACVRKRDEKR